MRKSSIVLLSGGLDSLASFHWATVETDVTCALTFDYGQQAAAKEIEQAQKICKTYDVSHRVVEIPWMGKLKNSALINTQVPLPQPTQAQLDDKTFATKSAASVWVPNRNGVFLNIAASFAEELLADWLIVGFNKEEAATFPDNSEGFVQASDKFFSYSTQNRVKVQAPMGSKTKKEIVKWALTQDVDLSLMWSCYRGGEKMCGACESCMRSRRALTEAEATNWLEKLF